jgi:RHS repeat-associated protein
VTGTNSPKLQIWIGNHYEEKDGKELFHVFAGGQRVCTFERDSILNGGSGTSTNYVGYFYHQDHLGSSSVLSDYAGNLKELSVWYPFGRTQTNNPAAPFKVSNRFTGQIQDEETGLYYYGARYYDPELGRFIQPDTIISDLSNPQSFNRYAYTLNNPLRYTDPDGHLPVPVVAGLWGAGVYGAEKLGEAIYVNSVQYQGAAQVAAMQRRLDEQTYERTGGQYNTYAEFAAARRGRNAPVQTKGSSEEAAALQALGNLTGEAVLTVPFIVAPELRAGKAAVETVKKGEKLTPRAARRQAMREADIPTSQQPEGQTSVKTPDGKEAGRQYDYVTPAPGGGTQKKSVQHSLTDQVPEHGPHWEAGNVKPGGQTDSLGRPRLSNEKVKVEEK